MTVLYPWKADPALWCGDTFAGLTLWARDQVPGDHHADAYPELLQLRRAISTTIGRELRDEDGHLITEVWWNGDLFYAGATPTGRGRFHGVLVSRDGDDPPFSPVRTRLWACAIKHTDASGHDVDSFSSSVKLEGPEFSPDWADDGPVLHPGQAVLDPHQDNAWVALRTGWEDNWWMMLTPSYHCLPPKNMHSSP